MAALFCDASAIVKRYANEVGSSWVMGVTDPASGNTILVARITEVEVVSGITRRVRDGTLNALDGSAGTLNTKGFRQPVQGHRDNAGINRQRDFSPAGSWSAWIRCGSVGCRA